jgi:hypothetical protein
MAKKNKKTVPEGIQMLARLADDELSKIPPVSEEEIRQALEKGRQERAAAEASARPLPAHSRILFR